MFLTFPTSTPKTAVDQRDAPERINSKLSGQGNAVVQWKVKKIYTPSKKIMNAYCERTGLVMTAMSSRFDGQDIVSEADTT